MNKKKLKKILELHGKWLRSDEDGVRANLRGCDLRGCNLIGSDLRESNFLGSNLLGSNFFGSDLSESNLIGCNLIGCNLRGCNLRESDLRESDLRESDLSGCNLWGCDLSGCDLSGVEYNEYTSFFVLQCPEQGSFIAWKKSQGKIVKLRVTENALRSSATTRKCRCSEAEVLEIDDGKLQEICSDCDESFVYKVGEIVKVDDFDTDRWNECSSGMHFFITRQEAENY